MPIYEYSCPGCGKRTTIFFATISSVESDPACPGCGGRGLAKLVSRVSVSKSEDTRMEEMADAGLGGLDESDPGSVARWAKRMGSALGDEMGTDLDGLAAEIEAGGPAPEAGEDWSGGAF